LARNVSFTRVCQPSPVARCAASTSGSMRSFTACFGAWISGVHGHA
jgi:hypothetical protein